MITTHRVASAPTVKVSFPWARSSRAVLFYVAVFACIAFFIMPVLWMAATAFKDAGEYVSTTPEFFSINIYFNALSKFAIRWLFRASV